MREFDFLEPDTVEDAVRAIADLGDEARVIAGGTALMLAMRQRMLAPTHLVSLGHLAHLRKIEVDAQGWLNVGALATHAEVAASPLIAQGWPMLASMAGRVANPQVRNQGTIGGNLCYADPATDPPGCLMALDARVTLASSAGERILSMAEFCIDYFTTAVEPGEVLTAIRIPPLAAGTIGLYTRHLRTAAEHRPLLNLALLARKDGNTCTELRIVVGASTPVPTRVPAAEAFLTGSVPSIELVAEAADIIARDITPISDARGEAAYRLDILRVVARRSLATLFGVTPDLTQEAA